jgi:RNA polymerase sigma-70 factor (ECF subfamily)
MTERDSEIGARLAAHEGRLRLLLLHLAGPAVRARVEVDDLVQEVFLRALSAEAHVRPLASDGELLAHLATLARRTVVDVVRAARARKRSGPEVPLRRSDWSRAGPVASRIPAPGPGPATEFAGREAGDRLAAAFLLLSAEHRRVIGLRQFEGLSAREAARRMGRSEAAVHSLYRRALDAWAAEAD